MSEEVYFADLAEDGAYEVFSYAPGIGIPILYMDNHLIAAVKPAGILSQADGSGKPDMLTILKQYIKVRCQKPGDVFLGLLHRLDCPVSGVMVFARTSKGASRVSAQIRERKVEKRYFAVADGKFDREEGRLTARLTKQPGNITGWDDEGKECALTYRVLQHDSASGRSLLDIRLETGRSHQIRFQFSAEGHPLAGDAKYGGRDSRSGDIALFAYSFSLKHPVRDQDIRLSAFPASPVFRKTFASYFNDALSGMKAAGMQAE